jgi:hypothetical protein
MLGWIAIWLTPHKICRRSMRVAAISIGRNTVKRTPDRPVFPLHHANIPRGAHVEAITEKRTSNTAGMWPPALRRVEPFLC